VGVDEQYYQKQSTASINPHKISNVIPQRNQNINPEVYLEAQKTSISQSNAEQKRAMLEVSQYLTLN
jgi:hypothetical protein